ncbi:MAG TPA: hypothetical protein PLO37_19265 [Candidatus Hydrogenedentes bacterium]|nr:hypothetical protein [Candidatus Hydrogenedentota bacterium]HPG68992.1 hypothetical protein [Candidatus Hydrogenedentota bacterium]
MQKKASWGWIIVLLVIASLAVAPAFGDQVATKGKPGGGTKPERISHTARQERPIQLGTSGGSVVDLANGYCCSGTLGALVQDAAGTQYVLSNTHVFAGDSALGGNGLFASVGDPINQPGFVDVSCQNISADYVASLTYWMPLIPGAVTPVDAAIAEVIPGAVDPAGRILEIGTIAADPVAAYLTQQVKKSGRTSGLTTGKVAGLNATVTVQYEDECAGNPFVTTFEGQILVTPGKFLKAGDSGSLLVEKKSTNPAAVGLLFAGSSQVAIANPIQDVLAFLGVSMVGVETAGASGAAPLAAAVANASNVKNRHASRLASLPKAVGHAVGVANGKPVIMLLVEQLTPEVQQAAPVALDNVPVEIWEVGRIVAY